MKTDNGRFGIKTNATIKYCPFCDDLGTSCNNTGTQKFIGCKMSHGRCNVCTDSRSPSLPWFVVKHGGWSVNKSKIKAKGMKKQIYRWMQNQMIDSLQYYYEPEQPITGIQEIVSVMEFQASKIVKILKSQNRSLDRVLSFKITEEDEKLKLNKI